MYAKYGHPEDDYIVTLYQGQERDRFALSFHHGEMPAFDYRTFDTLAETKSWAKNELGVTHWRGFDGQFVARPD